MRWTGYLARIGEMKVAKIEQFVLQLAWKKER